jgi:hypothetical protein
MFLLCLINWLFLGNAKNQGENGNLLVNNMQGNNQSYANHNANGAKGENLYEREFDLL